ncbi:MAG: hypothetical protein RQ723_07985 [Desulfuromonadales bacterium]|nr:hypothetical protein [Desulfuromonadales bacterium]
MTHWLVVLLAVAAGAWSGWSLGSRFGFFTGYLLAVTARAKGALQRLPPVL